MQADDPDRLLPKSRTVPIDGDAVRTRRILGGWKTQGEFAKEVNMSEDRLRAIERGGAKVYSHTIVTIANVLNVHWSKLVAKSVVEDIPEPDHPAKGQIVPVFVFIGNINNLDDAMLLERLKKLKTAAGLEGEITVYSVDEGSVNVALGMDLKDLVAAVAAFCQGKLDDIEIVDVKVPGEAMVWERLKEKYEIINLWSKSDDPEYDRIFYYYDNLFMTDLIESVLEAKFETLPRLRSARNEMAVLSGVKVLVFNASEIMYAVMKNANNMLKLNIDDGGTLTISRMGLQKPLALTHR